MFEISDNVISITKGDSAYLDVYMSNADGDYYDMQDGDSVVLTVREEADFSSPVLLKASSTTNIIKLSSDKTKLLEPGRYSYDVELKTADGDIFTIIGATGLKRKLKNFVVLPEVSE